MSVEDKPTGKLITRILAMPADTNPAGDIFGGWVLSQMDIAGGLVSKRISKGRTVTIAVDAMTFHRPVFIGDTVGCYVKVIKVGKTSIKVLIEAWAKRQYQEERIKVTEGIFTYVSVTNDRKPRPINVKFEDD